MSNTTTIIDKYSIMIVGKYLRDASDYINLVCVNSKYSDLLEMYHFNPISIKSKTLFPRIETQHLYEKEDEMVEGIQRYVIWYAIGYKQSIESIDNVQLKNIEFTERDRMRHYNQDNPNTFDIPSTVNSIGRYCFSDCTSLSYINIPMNVTSIGNFCFSNCYSLKCIDIPSTVVSVGDYCFNCCYSLTKINVQSPSISFGNFCFGGCCNLDNIPTTKN
ncbi:Leucine rich repeat protein bspa family [Entamoeba marina]